VYKVDNVIYWAREFYRSAIRFCSGVRI
jgi:hypothetical protein